MWWLWLRLQPKTLLGIVKRSNIGCFPGRCRAVLWFVRVYRTIFTVPGASFRQHGFHERGIGSSFPLVVLFHAMTSVTVWLRVQLLLNVRQQAMGTILGRPRTSMTIKDTRKSQEERRTMPMILCSTSSSILQRLSILGPTPRRCRWIKRFGILIFSSLRKRNLVTIFSFPVVACCCTKYSHTCGCLVPCDGTGRESLNGISIMLLLLLLLL